MARTALRAPPTASEIAPFWTETADALFKRLESGKSGLTTALAQDRIGRLPKVETHQGSWRFVRLFLQQFKSPIIIILLFAAGLSVFLGDRGTAAIIFAIVFASGSLGFWQEHAAADAVQKLLAMVQIKATVVRDGKE